jgi:hypothetical protein
VLCDVVLLRRSSHVNLLRLAFAGTGRKSVRAS